MIQLHEGNVLLKPSHRRQLHTALKRVVRAGERIGKFVLKITIRRVGPMLELQASVRDALGMFHCRLRGLWQDVIRDCVRQLRSQLHLQQLSALRAR